MSSSGSGKRGHCGENVYELIVSVLRVKEEEPTAVGNDTKELKRMLISKGGMGESGALDWAKKVMTTFSISRDGELLNGSNLKVISDKECKSVCRRILTGMKDLRAMKPPDIVYKVCEQVSILLHPSIEKHKLILFSWNAIAN